MYEYVRLPIMFCCNDYRNGMFEGKVSTLEFGEGLTLECSFAYWSPSMRIKNKAVYIARKKLPILSYREWVGNWCWDRAYSYGKHIIEFLNWLKTKNWYFVENAEERLSEIWRNPKLTFKDKHIAILQKYSI